MVRRRVPVIVTLLIGSVFLSVAGVSLVPWEANARPIVGSGQNFRSVDPHSFALAARHIAALRGINTAVLSRRFTTLARTESTDVTGSQAGGETTLVNNWHLSPAGSEAPLGDFPANSALSPDGAHILVVNSGAGVQSVQVVDSLSHSVQQTISYYAPHSAFIGVAYSSDGAQAYVAGGGENVVHTFSVGGDGALTATGDVTLGTVAPVTSQNPYPTGLSVSPDGKTVYVANAQANTIALIDTASHSVTGTIPVGTAPYTTIASPTTKYVWVSNWGSATLSVVDPTTKAVVATVPVGNHPSAMTATPNGMLYVSDSNSDAVSIVNMQTMSEVRRLSVVPLPDAPLSSSPQGLAVSPDGRRLYVADAGDNDIAVFALHPDGSGAEFQGWIPTAWYPTSVQVSADNSTLLVTNGFGDGEGPNSTGLYPDPTRPNFPLTNAVDGFGGTYCKCQFNQFSGSMNVGTLSAIGVPSPGQLTDDTLQVMRNDRFFDRSIFDRSAGNPVPLPGGASPIKHVIYVVKENRTYDQVLGDVPTGNGDPSLTLFGKSVTPNLHALAERFGVIDNFYADAQVSADGHNWALSANASDYAEKLWPQDYSASPGRNFGYPFEGGTALPQSPGGYIWDDAAAANLTYRDYGLYSNFPAAFSTATVIPQDSACTGPTTAVYQGATVPPGNLFCFQPITVNAATSPALVGHLDPKYQAYDLRYRDIDRISEWQREFNQNVANNDLPQLELLRLSSDHTSGTIPNSWTPQYYAADNDAAVGKLVDIVSHSKYWASTAIFVTEDDAQNGPDHVDSHRTEALVISPYTSQVTPRAENVHYDTAAMLRTIELILGLGPLSKYDATATPMSAVFSSNPDVTPYNAITPAVPSATNTLQAYGAVQSKAINFALPDQAPTAEMNRILWHAVKGNVPYPGPADTAYDPALQRYVWGIMDRKTNPLLHYHGIPMPRIVARRPHRTR
jgi:YVTN family beta-propeller protein